MDKCFLYCDGSPELLFTENETNNERLFNSPNRTPFVKDAFHRYIVNGEEHAVNPEMTGTKAAANYELNVPAGESVTVRLRLTNVEVAAAKKNPAVADPVFGDFDDVFKARIADADEFYSGVIFDDISEDARSVQRQALAGMLWSKQFYHYVVEQWLTGDPAMPKPPESRWHGRNHSWTHLYNADVISMPDKWEYPWYAAWDLAFHCIALSLVDSEFAKEQLILMLREWYMHPNGQIPAYEWEFSDVNPPVHAWAALRVYQIEKKRTGVGDRKFLARVFQKLLLNFTWWVNRKDEEGNNIFEGGFLGLDNIGIFDRSRPLPTGGKIAQSDGTSWMAMYSLNLLSIALELAEEDDTYEDLASKFWEHFIFIAEAMNNLGNDGISLWDDVDGFYYDVLHMHDSGYSMAIKIRSMVGLIPLFAVATIDFEMLEQMPDFRRRMQWFIDNRPDLTANINCARTPGMGERRLLADRLPRTTRAGAQGDA